GDKPASQVVAKVNGTELTVHQVNFALQRIPNLNPEQSKAASLQVARNLVDQELAVQQALADKLDRDATVMQALDAARRQILAEAWMNRKVGAPAEPTDAEVQEYFKAHPELFAERKLYRLQEVSIKVPEDQREAVRAQLAASKSLNEFGEWLKAKNYEAKAAQGVKPAEQLPLAMLPQLSRMSKGQATVVNTPDGLLVVIVADTQAQPVTLEQAKPAIVRLLQTQARQKAIQAQVDALKSAAKIEYLGEFAAAGKEPAAAAAPAGKLAAPAADADAEAISKGVSGLK
ncbi:MAG: EpsD family peptidyl-prolyl cis-trans isomerase, partial [Chloroflexota bacterium]